MNRWLALFSLLCYLAACSQKAVIIPGVHGYSLEGFFCLVCLPMLLRAGAGPLLLAWLANPAYALALFRALRGKPGHDQFAWLALVLSLGFPAHCLWAAGSGDGSIQVGPGCVLWYLAMISLLVPGKKATTDSDFAQTRV